MNDHTLFVFRTNLIDVETSPHEGLSQPEDFFWGYWHLKRAGESVGLVNAPRMQKRRGIRRLTWLPERLFARFVRIGLPIDIFPTFWKQFRSTGAIVCVNDQISFGVLFWRLVGFIDKNVKLFCVIMSTQERLLTYRLSAPMRPLIRAMLNGADKVLVLSDVAADDLSRETRLEKEKIEVLRFGVDVNFWIPVEASYREQAENLENRFFFSLGNDINRDYKTVIDAFRGRDSVKILSREIRGVVPPNVEVIDTFLDAPEVRKLYQRSLATIVASRRLTSEPSGLSSALQAMACGSPLIISKSPALEEYFRGAKVCLFFEPGYVDDLREKISFVLSNPYEVEKMVTNASELVRGRFTTANLGDSLRAILGKR